MNYGNYFEELLNSEKNFNVYGISFQSNYDSSYSFSFIPTALWKYLYFSFMPFEKREGDILEGMILLDRNIQHEVVSQKWNVMLDKLNLGEIKLRDRILVDTKDKLVILPQMTEMSKNKLIDLFNHLQASKMKQLQKGLFKQAVKTEGIFALAFNGTLQIDRIKAYKSYINNIILPAIAIRENIVTLKEILEYTKTNKLVSMERVINVNINSESELHKLETTIETEIKRKNDSGASNIEQLDISARQFSEDIRILDMVAEGKDIEYMINKFQLVTQQLESIAQTNIILSPEQKEIQSDDYLLTGNGIQNELSKHHTLGYDESNEREGILEELSDIAEKPNKLLQVSEKLGLDKNTVQSFLSHNDKFGTRNKLNGIITTALFGSKMEIISFVAKSILELIKKVNEVFIYGKDSFSFEHVRKQLDSMGRIEELLDRREVMGYEMKITSSPAHQVPKEIGIQDKQDALSKEHRDIQLDTSDNEILKKENGANVLKSNLKSVRVQMEIFCLFQEYFAERISKGILKQPIVNQLEKNPRITKDFENIFVGTFEKLKGTYLWLVHEFEKEKRASLEEIDTTPFEKDIKEIGRLEEQLLYRWKQEMEELVHSHNADVTKEGIIEDSWVGFHKTLQQILSSNPIELELERLTEILDDPLVAQIRTSWHHAVIINDTLDHLYELIEREFEGDILNPPSELEFSTEKELHIIRDKNMLSEVLRHMLIIENNLIDLKKMGEIKLDSRFENLFPKLRDTKLGILEWFEKILYELDLSRMGGFKKEHEAVLENTTVQSQIEREATLMDHLGLDKTTRELITGDMEFFEIEQLVGEITDILDLEVSSERELRLDRLINLYRNILINTVEKRLGDFEKSQNTLSIDGKAHELFTGPKDVFIHKDKNRLIKMYELVRDNREALTFSYLHSLVKLPKEITLNLPKTKVDKLMREISIIGSGVFETKTREIFKDLLELSYGLVKQKGNIINTEIINADYSHKMPYIIRDMLTVDKEIKKFTQVKPFEFLDRMIRQIVVREGLKDLEPGNKKELLFNYLHYQADDKVKKELVKLENEYRLDTKNKEILLVNFLLEFERQMLEIKIIKSLNNIIKKDKEFTRVENLEDIFKQRRDIDIIKNKTHIIRTWQKLHILYKDIQGEQHILEIDKTLVKDLDKPEVKGDVLRHHKRLDKRVKEILNLAILLQLNFQVKEIFELENLKTLISEEEKELIIGGELITAIQEGEYVLDIIGIQERLEKIDKPVPSIQDILYALEKENKEILKMNIERILDCTKEKHTFIDKIYQLAGNEKELIGLFQEILADMDITEELYEMGQIYGDKLKDIKLDLGRLFDKLKNGDLVEKEEVDKLKEILVEIGFVFDEMYRRWYFMPSDGPYDDPLVPNQNWDYENNPINGFIEDPLPGREEGKGRILVDLDILKNVIDFMELLFRSNLQGYAGCTPEQAIKHFVTALFDWLDHQIPDVEDKIPEFYPDDYERYENPNMKGREDYWKIFRHIRWYSEGILNNISESERTDLKGAKYVRKIIDRMIEYYKDHHSDEDMKLDKFKGFRRRELSNKNKLLKKEEI